MQGQKQLNMTQIHLSDSAFDLFPGEEDFRVSTVFDSKAMAGQNLYFLAQDVKYSDIFYGSDESKDGHCIKRVNLTSGNHRECQGPSSKLQILQ